MTVKTESGFSKGLEDIVAAESSICEIDGKNSKLFFRGYDIHDLAENSTFEETAYLLLFGALPTRAELDGFSAKLAAEREVPAGVLESIAKFPPKANSMASLRTAISLLSFYDAEADDKSREANVRKALRLLARTPTLIAAIDRARRGEKPVAPKREASVSTAANFLYMMKGGEATPVEAKMLDKYYILLAEHDLNASTFAAIVTASTLSDIYSAMVSAVGTLKGELHGYANSRAMESILEIGDPSNVDAYVDRALAEKKKLMGFGHRVYKGPDPRAHDLRIMARTLAESNREQSKWFAISEKFEKAVWDRKKLYCNVDFYSASVLYTIGIPVDLFTPMFAVSRMAGWTAHVLEQYADNRLLRPVSNYVGKSNQRYVPI
ncbi:MAG TPA: citrate/2-methylcitrate synthase, partial [Candidatus Eisenbacteria bacterium]|nr:citrate/2-methylcitrate synthase [Candidatus Eisenbacteria bacterium]